MSLDTRLKLVGFSLCMLAGGACAQGRGGDVPVGDDNAGGAGGTGVAASTTTSGSSGTGGAASSSAQSSSTQVASSASVSSSSTSVASSSSAQSSSSSGSGGGGPQCVFVGSATDIATGQLGLTSLTSDATHVYWSTFDFATKTGVFLRAPQSGGAPEVLASTAQYPAVKEAFNRPDSMLIAGGNLIWRAAAGDAVYQMPVTGGPPTALFDQTTQADDFQLPSCIFGRFLSVAGGTIYWSRQSWTNMPTFQSSVLSMPLAGGPATTLIQYAPTSGSVGGGNIACATHSDGTNLYFTSMAGLTPGDPGNLVHAGLDGSNPLNVSVFALGLASDAQAIYFGAVELLMGFDKQKGMTAVLDQPAPGDDFINYDVALDATHVYAAARVLAPIEQQGCGEIRVTPKTGGGATVAWSGLGDPALISLANGTVFWADIDLNLVRSIPAP